jgi:hypothetical protein
MKIIYQEIQLMMAVQMLRSQGFRFLDKLRYLPRKTHACRVRALCAYCRIDLTPRIAAFIITEQLATLTTWMQCSNSINASTSVTISGVQHLTHWQGLVSSLTGLIWKHG